MVILSLKKQEHVVFGPQQYEVKPLTPGYLVYVVFEFLFFVVVQRRNLFYSQMGVKFFRGLKIEICHLYDLFHLHGLRYGTTRSSWRPLRRP